MRAIRVHQFGEPDVMVLEDVPDLVPGADELIVRVHAAGVNPVDTYIRAGVYAKKPELPYTPGMDAAGVVEQVGADVADLAVGQRVYVSGTLTGAYAEQVRAWRTDVHPLPDNVPFAQGAGIHVPYATAYRALFQRAHARAGEAVLVHGASGGVGIAACQLARAAGLFVVGTAGTADGLELAAANGAHAVFNHRDDGDYLAKAVAQANGGQGFDVIVEMLANVNLQRDLESVTMGGRIVVVGSRGPIEINPRNAMGKDAAILGMSLFNAGDANRREIHAALHAGLSKGTLRPVVSAELPLAQAADAHRQVMEPGARGKIVLIP